MSNELPVTDVVTTQHPHGVISVTPTYVQPVVVTGSVTVVQPVAISQPVTVDQGAAGASPWLVTFIPSPSTVATVTAVVVTTSPTVLLPPNLLRKGFAVQNTTDVVFIKLDTTASLALYSYELPRKGILEIENYCGPVTAIVPSGTITVFVTEKV